MKMGPRKMGLLKTRLLKMRLLKMRLLKMRLLNQKGVPNSADGPAAVAEEPGPGLDEILADMESGVSADTYSDELSGEMAAAENTGVKISGTGEPGSHMPDAAATEEPSLPGKRAAGKKKETKNTEAAERPTVTDGTVEAAERMDVDREEAETPSLGNHK